MMRWLRKFLYSDDPIVKVATGLLEPEAEMWRDILDQEGIPAYAKVMDPVARSEGVATGTNTALFVRQSDVERARELLEPLSGRGQLVEEG
jgi:hypothetical protein